MKRAILIISAFAIVILGFIYIRYIFMDKENDDKSGYSNEIIRIQHAPVHISKAFMGELNRRVTSSGVTEAIRETEVKSQIGARVIKVLVVDGQRVSRGAILVELDDREYRIALQEAKARLLNARLEYALMKKDRISMAADQESLEQLDSLKIKYQAALEAYNSKNITVEELLDIEREYQIARIMAGHAQEELIRHNSGLASAEAEFARIEYNLINCKLTAPFDGIVGNLKISEGAIITTNQPLLRLVDLAILKLKLQVLESEIGYIHTGEIIRAQFDAFPDTVITGRIQSINPIIDSNTRTCTVIAEIDNPDGILISGMYATSRITISRHKDRLLVPRNAVVVRDQRKLIFIVREEKAFWCYVDTGLENNEFIEIISSEFNLMPGEPVIVDGQFALAHNAPVRILNEIE